MIDNLDSYLIGIALGIRFRANFSIEDQLGRILDSIIYPPNSYFNAKVFPEAKGNVGKRIICNELTRDYLNIDNSNIILDINFYADGGFKSSDIDDIINNYESQIIKGVMREFKIKEISRIGYIKRYLFELEELAKSFMDKTVNPIGKTLEGVNDINLRFSKKLVTHESLAKRDVNDYDNVIFNVIKHADKQEIFMSIDYQSYYDPFLPSSTELPFSTFISQANRFNQQNYLTWLNSNYMVQHEKKS